MQGAETGDESFEEFVASAARGLRRTAYLMCGDWQRAEDAAQDALVKVYLAWSRLHRPGRRSQGLRSYAHRAVVTCVIDQSRRPWRREVSTDELPERTAPTDTVEQQEGRDAVLTALAGRDPARRERVGRGDLRLQRRTALNRVRVCVAAGDRGHDDS